MHVCMYAYTINQNIENTYLYISLQTTLTNLERQTGIENSYLFALENSGVVFHRKKGKGWVLGPQSYLGWILPDPNGNMDLESSIVGSENIVLCWVYLGEYLASIDEFNRTRKGKLLN